MAVYFIQQGYDGPVKIGYSEYPYHRLSSLQVSSPQALSLLGVIPGDEGEENRLHCQFKKYRIGGEWFRSSPELLRFIRCNATKDLLKSGLEELATENACLKHELRATRKRAKVLLDRQKQQYQDLIEHLWGDSWTPKALKELT